MSQAQQHSSHFTFADYLTWPDEERWEIIEGVAYNMTPAPSTEHQAISIELSAQLQVQLRGKTCRAFHAPFDIRLPAENETAETSSTVVQPDISVICDERKVDNKGGVGAPDFIIEIISPGTAAKDQVDKLALYEKHGVREYWIIHPADQLLTIRVLDNTGRYARPTILPARGQHAVSVLEGVTFDLDPLFAPPPAASASPAQSPAQ